jgi:hypothetical protein
MKAIISPWMPVVIRYELPMDTMMIPVICCFTPHMQKPCAQICFNRTNMKYECCVEIPQTSDIWPQLVLGFGVGASASFSYTKETFADALLIANDDITDLYELVSKERYQKLEMIA